MGGKRLAGIIGVCTVAIVITAVLVALRTTPASEAMLVTQECTDRAITSLTAQGEVTDDGGDWVTRRGFQYLEGTSGDPPDIVPVVNASFEYRDPPAGWSYLNGSGERTAEKAKVGSHSLKFAVDENQFGNVLQTDPIPPEEVSGKALAFGAWVWSDAPDRVRLYATYWVGANRTDRMSAYHPGDGNWHWMTLTVRFPAGVTTWNLRAINTTQGPAITVYADGFFAAWGDELKAVLEDGEFGTGTYSLVITGLEPDRLYRVRAFAQNEAGVGYGNIVTCRTAAAQ